jgi:hypothetical protein
MVTVLVESGPVVPRLTLLDPPPPERTGATGLAMLTLVLVVFEFEALPDPPLPLTVVLLEVVTFPLLDDWELKFPTPTLFVVLWLKLDVFDRFTVFVESGPVVLMLTELLPAPKPPKFRPLPPLIATLVLVMLVLEALPDPPPPLTVVLLLVVTLPLEAP